jgi:hypothetical protein
MDDVINRLSKLLNSGIDLNDYLPKFSHHINVSNDKWLLSKWREDEITFRHGHVIDDHEKIWNEAIECQFNPNKTVLPTQYDISDNVILTQGMSESIDRDIGVVSTTINWASIGTSATAEAESQTDLQAEDTGGAYVRKQISTLGQRTRVNQTAKYGMVWDDGDISAVGLAIKEAGLHYNVSAAAKCHARVTFTTFTLNSGDLFVSQINETHANGTL